MAKAANEEAVPPALLRTKGKVIPIIRGLELVSSSLCSMRVGVIKVGVYYWIEMYCKVGFMVHKSCICLWCVSVYVYT